MRGPLAAVVAVAVVLAACGGADDPTTVAAACSSVRDLHNQLAATANDTADREIGADPEARAAILAQGLDDLIELVDDAELPGGPAELVVGLDARRRAVVEDMTANAADFRQAWPSVSTDQRASAVPKLFIWLERMMAETQPVLPVDASPDLVAAVLAEPACEFVIDTQGVTPPS